MDRPADQLEALLDLARSLTASGIPYALIGGIAVGIHSASPRATADIDVAVPTSVDRAFLVSALEGRGFRLRREFPHGVNFLHPNGEPVQVAADPGFDPMIERAEQVEVGRIAVAIVTKEDLIAMKERAATDPAQRPSKALRDRADVEMLRGDVPEPDEGW